MAQHADRALVTTKRVITDVYLFQNGLVMVLDQAGKQMPAYQGHLEEVLPKIRAVYQGLVWHAHWFTGQVVGLLDAPLTPLLPEWAASIANQDRRSGALIYDPEYEEFCRMRSLPDGRRLIADRYGYGQARLVISLMPPLEEVGVFADLWIFPTPRLAIYALETWDPDLVKEPAGWYRHPHTARRRKDGDVAQEYIWQ